MRIVRNNDENGSNLERHFRELRNLETPPSSDLWDKLEYRLDDDRERIKHDHWYKALILLLIPFTIINMLITYDSGDYRLSLTPADEQQPSTTASQNSITGNPGKAGGWGYFLNGSFVAPFYAHRFVPDADDRVVASRHAMIAPATVAPVDAGTSAQSVAPDELSLLERKMLETSATRGDLVKYHTRKAVNEVTAAIKGFHVGAEGSVNNTWMLHKNNSLHPLIGNRIHRKFDMGATYGISAGYDFSKRYGVEAEWIIHSQQGQEYWELRYGKIRINGEVNLEYMHLPVMFKYKWAKVSPRSLQPRVLNLVTGIQYSRLIDAQVVQNGMDLDNVHELFNRDEMGLLLGTEYDIYFHRNYYVSMGLRASISTDARAFPYFNSENTETYNLMIGVNASINYLAKRRSRN